ncbi:hypothetical protein Bpro_5012 (plasmid) [Polaromonas sp. JS666]|nr:hypothetical protein Bpro_5012 [Polaromonas sp. JS666]
MTESTNHMAHIVVVQFLVEHVEGEVATETINRKLRTVVSPIGSGEDEGSPLLDFKIAGAVPADEKTTLAVANQSYREWEVFNDGKDTDHYLVVIEGDVSPVVSGRYESDPKRVQAAQAYRTKHGNDDGLYRLDVPKGTPVALGAFAGAEVEGGEVDELTNFVVSEILEGRCPIERINVPGSKYFTVLIAGDELVVDKVLLAALEERFSNELVEFSNGVSDFILPSGNVESAMQIQWAENTAAGHSNLSLEQWKKKHLKGAYK